MAHILVDDDDERVTQVLGLLLEKSDYRMSVAKMPRDGMRILRDDAVDVLVVDIFMPKVSGLDIIRRLKRELPEVKILAISGGATIAGRDCLELAIDAGADDTLRKPLTARELIGSIQGLIPESPQEEVRKAGNNSNRGHKTGRVGGSGLN